jgi:membrane protease YdiL (CAAX protease family)
MPFSATAGRWLVFVVLLGEGSLVLLAWGAAWLFDVPLWQSLRWDAGAAAALGTTAALPMLLLFWGCLHTPLSSLQRIRQLCEEVIGPLFAPCSLTELALLAGLAGLGEEALFRGVAQPALARWLDLWSAVALTSLIFGLLHALTPTYALLAGLMSVYLGILRAATGNLLVVVLAHALYDFVALVYLGRSQGDKSPGA